MAHGMRQLRRRRAYRPMVPVMRTGLAVRGYRRGLRVRRAALQAYLEDLDEANQRMDEFQAQVEERIQQVREEAEQEVEDSDASSSSSGGSRSRRSRSSSGSGSSSS
jgi:hypothetical protein